MRRVFINKRKWLPYLPAALGIIYVALVDIGQGMFSINGIWIPFMQAAGYAPHDYTVVTWCVMYAVIWRRTGGLDWITRMQAAWLTVLASTLIQHDSAWLVEVSRNGLDLGRVFVGSGGGPTYLAIGLGIMGCVILLGKIRGFVRIDGLFWIFGAAYAVSLWYLTATGYWDAWELYNWEGIGSAPQGWACAASVFSGQAMWCWLIGTGRINKRAGALDTTACKEG